MAQITVVYKDFDEMKAVARELLKSELSDETRGQAQAVVPTQSTPVQPSAAVTSEQPVPTVPTAPVPPAGVPTSVPAQTAVPTSRHEYTRDDLARAAMTLMDKGGMVQLQQLLTSYGCETLQQLTEDQFGSFATSLRGMGAQI